MKIRGTTITTPLARHAVADDSAVSRKTWSSKNTVDKLCPAFSENGTVVRCEPIEGYPLDITSHIEPIQPGSGDPCPPGEGRNLWQVDTNTVTGAYIDATSIAAYSGYSYVVYIPCEPNTTYTVSKFKGKRFSVAYCTELPAVGVPIYGYVTDGTATSITITTGGDAKYLAAYVYFGGTDDSTTTWNAAKKTIQIEKGDVATEYQPYSNIRPISGFDSVKLWRGGKNLCGNTPRYINKNGADVSFIDNILRYHGSWSGNQGFGDYSEKLSFWLPAGTYTWSVNRLGGTCSGALLTFGFKNAMNGWVASYSSTAIPNFAKQFTLPEPTRLCLCAIGGGTYDDYRCSVQIEAGEVGTAFEPYRVGNFTAQLGQTVYGGSLDWKTGVLTVDKTVVSVDGTEAWTHNSVYTGKEGLRYDLNVASDLLGVTGNEECVCSHYPHVAANQGRGVWLNPTTSSTGLRILWTYETVDELKAYLAEQYAAGTPVTFLYELATPITIQLTPQEITALSGENTIFSDCGDTTVTGKADPVSIIEKLTNAIIALGGNV